MGWNLAREIWTHLPSGMLTHRERLVVLAIADKCGEESREGWPGADWLVEICDLENQRNLGKVLASVAKKWVELRVQIGKDKAGRPVYAFNGTRTTYRFPPLAELIETGKVRAEPVGSGAPEKPVQNGGASPASPDSKPVQIGGASRGESPSKLGAMPPQFGRPSSSVTSKTSSSSSARESLSALAEVLEEEDEELIQKFRNHLLATNNPKVPSLWLARLIQNGSIHDQYRAWKPAPVTQLRPRCDFDPARDGETCQRCGLPARNASHGSAA